MNALNQKISQFLDDELPHDEALILLEKMRGDAALSSQMQRYEAIGHALKTERFLTLRTDFSANIAQQIAQEPIHLVPPRKVVVAAHHYKWLAVAASVAIVSVLAVRTSRPPLGGAHAPSTLQVAQQQIPQPLATVAPVVAAQKPEQDPLNTRIHDYLQAHANDYLQASSSSGAGINGPLSLEPIGQVTSYDQK
jgi:sigma-E factor negative regulatory protein RseA